MRTVDALRREWRQLSSYERFEQVVSRVLLVLISIIIVYTLVLATIELVRDFRLGPDFLDTEVLQDTFSITIYGQTPPSNCR